jgi:hypothetical protein
LFAGSFAAGSAGIVVSLMVSVPAAMLFLISMRRWPMVAGNAPEVRDAAFRVATVRKASRERETTGMRAVDDAMKERVE